MEDEDAHYGTIMREHEIGYTANDEQIILGQLDGEDSGYDSGIDLPEVMKEDRKLQVVMQDGRVCAWWVL